MQNHKRLTWPLSLLFPAGNTGLTLNTIGSLRCIPCGGLLKVLPPRLLGHIVTDREKSISRTRSSVDDRPYTSPNTHVTTNMRVLGTGSVCGCSFPAASQSPFRGEKQAWTRTRASWVVDTHLLMQLPYIGNSEQDSRTSHRLFTSCPANRRQLTIFGEGVPSSGV